MAIHYLQNAVILYDGLNFSTDMNQVAMELGSEPLDVTTFGQGTRIMKSGLLTVATNVTGFWDDDIDNVLFADIAATGNPVLSIFPISATDGQRGFSYKTMRSNYNPTGAVGEMFTFSADGPAAKSRLSNTTVLSNVTAATTSATGTAANLGDFTATGELFGVLHVTRTNASGTLDVVLESDSASGFASPTTRMTFTQIGTTVTAEYLNSTTDSSGDTWWRANYTVSATGGPSYDFVVGMSILPRL
jgi:hypothetical protein